jgi:hypothetical protein
VASAAAGTAATLMWAALVVGRGRVWPFLWRGTRWSFTFWWWSGMVVALRRWRWRRVVAFMVAVVRRAVAGAVAPSSAMCWVTPAPACPWEVGVRALLPVAAAVGGEEGVGGALVFEAGDEVPEGGGLVDVAY